MKRYVILFFTILLFACPSAVHSIEGLPGSTWGYLHWDIPHNEQSDLILEGWIRQGVALKRWERGTARLLLTTYLTARYKWDSESLDWNNYLGPGVGAAIDYYAPRWPIASWGIEYIQQQNYRSGDDNPYTALFMNWFHWWDIQNKGYPGTTWGDLRWEIPNSGTKNLILEGWVRQGITLKRWERGQTNFLLGPYGRIRYKWDSRGLDWNNYVAPGVGIALDMESGKGPLVSWGVEYSWQKNYRSGDDVHLVEVFMRWYAWWDLKKPTTGE